MDDIDKSKVKVKELFESIAGVKNLLVFLHDNPDPDAIASGYALQKLVAKKVDVHPLLCAALHTGRPENMAMVKEFNIKVVRPSDVNFRIFKSLAAVDTQPGTGNNSIPKNILPRIIIDHHPLRRSSIKAPFTDIRTDIGATSTILTEYYAACGIKPTKSVATALLYGVKTDTLNLSRSTTDADIRAHTFLLPFIHQRKLARIEVPNLDAAHYSALIRGIVNARVYGNLIFADLGTINSVDEVAQAADLLIRNLGSSCSVVMGDIEENIYLSMRLANGRKNSSALIRKIIGRYGNAGGHGRAAAGRISMKGLSEEQRKSLKNTLYKKIFAIFSKKEDEYSFLVPPSTQDYLSSANIPELPQKSNDKEVTGKIGML